MTVTDQPTNLSDFILAEVHRQTSEDAMRKHVEAKIGDTIKHAVDSAFRTYGNIGQQIEKCVTNSLSIGDRLDIPSYSNMVMALLRAKMDETVSDLVNTKLADEMASILKLAPKELKLSDLVKELVDAQDKSDRWGSHVTCIVDHSDTVKGYASVFLDHGEDVRKYDCETAISVDAEGKIYSLKVDRKDAARTITMGPFWGWQKMVFAAYACGSKFIVDDTDPDTSIGGD